MTIRILFNVLGLQLENVNSNYYADATSISQNLGFRKMSFYCEGFIKMAGQRLLLSETKYAYGFAVVDIPQELQNDRHELSKLLPSQTYLRYRNFESFLQFLWFVKDNRISIDTGFGYIPKADLFMEMKGSSSNSSASGTFPDTIFTKEELDLVTKIITQYNKYCSNRIVSTEHVPYTEINQQWTSNNKPEVKSYNEYNRIQRAILFLANARNTPDLSHKIALYIPIFECLFSVDNEEIKHKVSERTAYYLGKTREERLEIYNTVSYAYNIRSRFMHGSLIKHNKKPITAEQLQSTSIKLDQILRLLLTKVIMEDTSIFLEENDEAMRSYHNSLIFR